MQFVKSSNLKPGMRLARPIYNKQGVLLYERDSKLTPQSIVSIANFGLIGLFILEPAEPVPPMTQADIEFERFQTMTVFMIQDELQKILSTNRVSKLLVIAGNIVKNYGHLDRRINFIQSLRSLEDYIYKHALNVSILSAMITHTMNCRLDEQQATVVAAILHDIGKLGLPQELQDKSYTDDDVREQVLKAQTGAYELIENAAPEGTQVRRICMMSEKLLETMDTEAASTLKLPVGARILTVADMFDSMTAMKEGGKPMSEVAALKFMLERPEIFDSEVVDALIRCVNILVPGVSVELNSGEKALILRENPEDILRPMILSFRDNSIIDLSNEVVYGDLEIADIMKTLDNRYIFDKKTLEEAGFQIELEEYV